MPRPTNVHMRDRILEMLRERLGSIVPDAMVMSETGVSGDTIKVYVHYLREAGHEIRRVRGEGYVLYARRQDAEDHDDPLADGRDWRAEHDGDPLLEALRLHHPELA